MNFGYEVHSCANYTNFKDDKNKYEVKMHQIDFYRNPFNFKNFKAYKQLINLMRNEEFDLVHCNTPIGGFLGRICAKKCRVSKVIYTAHGFHFYKGNNRIKNLVFKNIEKWLAKYTDVLITINKEDYEEAQKFKLRNNSKRVYKVHGVGIDTKKIIYSEIEKEELRNELKISSDDIVCIAMGDLIKRKNYSASIKAIANTQNSKIHLLICGNGYEKENLIKLAKSLNIEKQIHFLGFRDDIKKLLSISDIFLFTTFQEGLPRSLMEAMASGLPCVVSKIRGNVDLIENNKGGFLCKPNDNISFSNALNELAHDTLLREKMGKINLEEIKKYDVNVVKSEIKEIYSNI